MGLNKISGKAREIKPLTLLTKLFSFIFNILAYVSRELDLGAKIDLPVHLTNAKGKIMHLLPCLKIVMSCACENRYPLT